MSNTAPFLHIAYANNDTGTLDFTTTGGIERTYTGFYTDEYATDSSDPTKYKWLTNAEFKNKVNAHVAYAESSDGVTSFTTTYPNLNLLNFNSNFTLGKFLDWSTGTLLTSHVQRATFDYIPVTPNTKYTFSANWGNGRAFSLFGFNSKTDSSATTIFSGVSNAWFPMSNAGQFINKNTTITIPDGINFIRMSWFSSETLTMQIILDSKPKVEEGSVVTQWMPSASEVKDSGYPKFIGVYYDNSTTASNDPTKYKWLSNADFKNKVSTVAYAKSADGKDDFTNVYPNVNLLNFNSGVTLGKHYGWAADAITLSANRAIFNKVKVIPNSQYTISANWSNTEWLNIYAFTNESDTTAIARYGSAGGLGAGFWDTSFVGGFTVAKDITFTVPANVNYIGISYTSLSKDTLTLQALLNGKPKLELGSTVTPWIPSVSEVKDSDYPQYIGLPNVINPTTFKDYEWSLLESIPKKILNTHVAYANSSDGVTDFTTVYPNLNLLDGTKDFSGTWSYTDAWTNDGTYKGLTVKKKTKQWNGICKIFTVPKDGIYTFSAYVKSSGNIASINRFGGVNTLQTQPVLQRPMGNNFNWTRDIVTLNLKANDTVYIRYEIAGSGTDSILWTAGHKWEEGSVATPYMPSASEVKDSDYPKFVGVYGDDSTTASQVPAVYKWSSIPVPGPTPPIVDNVYVLTMPTVRTIKLTYGIGTLTTKPTSWLSAKPKLDVNQVLWYKSEITGTDNSVGVYYSNLVGGTNLDDGDSPLDNTVVSIVLNNKTVNVPRDLALKLELLSQTLGKRDDDLAQLIADTNDRITNIDMGSGQAGLNQEVLDRRNADDSLGLRIDTVTGNVSDLTTTTQTKFTNIEKQLGGFSVQGTKSSSLTRPSIVFNYNAYGATLSDGSSDGGGRLYYQVPGDTTYDVKELKFNYQTIPSFYDMDQITIWEDSWSKLYGGFPWRDTIVTTSDIDTFYIDGMTTYYDHNGDLVIRGKVVMDGMDDWIGSMNNRGFKPDTVVITIASDLKSVNSIRFTGDMGVIVMNISLGYGAISSVQRLGRKISFIGASPKNTLTTTGSWVNLNEKIPYGMRPINSIEISTGLLNSNNTVNYLFGSDSVIRIYQSSNNANQFQVMGQVGWETLNQYPPVNYSSNTGWNSR